MALAPSSGSTQSDSPSEGETGQIKALSGKREGNIQANVMGILSAATRSTSGILA